MLLVVLEQSLLAVTARKQKPSQTCLKCQQEPLCQRSRVLLPLWFAMAKHSRSIPLSAAQVGGSCCDPYGGLEQYQLFVS